MTFTKVFVSFTLVNQITPTVILVGSVMLVKTKNKRHLLLPSTHGIVANQCSQLKQTLETVGLVLLTKCVDLEANGLMML